MTGASSGIGQQCAIDCSRMGAKVILIARTETHLQETLLLLDHPERHCYYMFDLFQTGQIKPLVDEIVENRVRLMDLSMLLVLKNFASKIVDS